MVEVVDRVQKRPGGRSARVRAAVIGAVRAALEAGDVDALSIERLAEAASVHRSTIYRRWPTTDLLLAELLRSLIPVETPMPDTGALAGDLRILAARVANTIRSPLIESTLRHAAASNDPELVEAAGEYWEAVLDRSADIVRRSQARGDSTPEISPVDAVESLLSPLYFRLLVSRRSISAVDIEAMVERTARMLAPRTRSTPQSP